LLLIASSINVNIYFTGIQAKEYAALHKSFSTLIISENEKIVLIRPEHNLLQTSGYYNYSYSDEFGQLSSSRNWVPIPLLKQIIKENNSTSFIPEIETYRANELYKTTGSNSRVIDLTEILTVTFERQ
jgi:hypothetical protein